MPSAELLLHFQVCPAHSSPVNHHSHLQAARRADGQINAAARQDDLAIQSQWFVNGKHYSKTLEAWLRKMDLQKDSIMPIFQVCAYTL